MLSKADIATVDNLYPDEAVQYTYIGMSSMAEGIPLLIYFNSSVNKSTLTESWDSFDLSEYNDRITNIDELVNDMESVAEAGITNVMKIAPNELLEFHEKEAFKVSSGITIGNWAIYQNKLYAIQGKKLHALWFEDIGLPSWGEAYDKVPRGWYEIDNDELSLVVYNEGYPQHVDTLFRNENRLVEKAKQLEGIDHFDDVQLYEVSGISKRRVGQKLMEEGIMQKIGQELKEEDKIALLMKYAGNDYLRFETGATLHAYVDALDLTSNQAVIDIKKSELSPDDKVIQIKEIARAVAIEKLQELTDAVPGISITYGSVDQDIDNMNWDEILIDEE